MALIPVFHVVASNHPIDPSSATNLPAGTIVTVNTTTGFIEACNGASNWAIGVAADSRSTGVTSYTATSGAPLTRNPETSLEGALVMGTSRSGHVVQRYTQNRVSDNYNEVLASGKMTVYQSGGEFWTDQYEIIQRDGHSPCYYNPGDRLYASHASEATPVGPYLGVEPEGQRAGRFTDEVSSINQVIGVLLEGPLAYPSGVPGTTVPFNSALGGAEGGNSLSYGSMLHFKLSI